MRYGFGIDIGGTTVKLAWFDEAGTMLKAWEIPTVKENAGAQILPDIARAVKAFLEENPVQRENIIGIGLGVPGPVDENGFVNQCVNLGWGRFNVQQQLAQLTGLPVKAGNDANVAAMGEYWKGGGEGCRNMVFATLGTGVGGGIVLGGNLLYGAHGAGGEIGHMVLNPLETEPCGCGKKGCVEQYCSASGVVRLAKRFLGSEETDSCLRSMEDIQCRDVFAAAEAGDGAAREILGQYYDYLGRFLGSLCSAVDPETVVLGGGVSKAGSQLISGLEPFYRRYAFHAVRDIPIKIAKLGNDAGAYGAFKLVLDAYG